MFHHTWRYCRPILGQKVDTKAGYMHNWCVVCLVQSCKPKQICNFPQNVAPVPTLFDFNLLQIILLLLSNERISNIWIYLNLSNSCCLSGDSLALLYVRSHMMTKMMTHQNTPCPLLVTGQYWKSCSEPLNFNLCARLVHLPLNFLICPAPNQGCAAAISFHVVVTLHQIETCACHASVSFSLPAKPALKTPCPSLCTTITLLYIRLWGNSYDTQALATHVNTNYRNQILFHSFVHITHFWTAVFGP